MTVEAMPLLLSLIEKAEEILTQLGVFRKAKGSVPIAFFAYALKFDV